MNSNHISQVVILIQHRCSLNNFIQVVHSVGLCIALWDITKLEDSYIFPGDGSSHTVGK